MLTSDRPCVAGRPARVARSLQPPVALRTMRRGRASGQSVMSWSTCSRGDALVDDPVRLADHGGRRDSRRSPSRGCVVHDDRVLPQRAAISETVAMVSSSCSRCARSRPASSPAPATPSASRSQLGPVGGGERRSETDVFDARIVGGGDAVEVAEHAPGSSRSGTASITTSVFAASSNDPPNVSRAGASASSRVSFHGRPRRARTGPR